MSKKILSLALAVVMLFSICAVAANAEEFSEIRQMKALSFKTVKEKQYAY